MAKNNEKPATVSKAQSTQQVGITLQVQRTADAFDKSAETVEAAVKLLNNTLKDGASKLKDLSQELAEKEMLHQARVIELQQTYAELDKAEAAKAAELKAARASQTTAELKAHEENIRVLRFELDMKLKEDKAAVMGQLASEFGKVVIDKTEAEILSKTKEQVEEGYAMQLLKVRQEVEKQSQQHIDTTVRELQLMHQAESAKLVFANESLTSQLAASKEENARVLKQLDDLRHAMVQMSQAQATSAVNVFTDGKK